jgi:hypothetical protein
MLQQKFIVQVTTLPDCDDITRFDGTYMSSNARGGGGELRGLSHCTAVHRSPSKIWRSNSIFKLTYEIFCPDLDLTFFPQ